MVWVYSERSAPTPQIGGQGKLSWAPVHPWSSTCHDLLRMVGERHWPGPEDMLTRLSIKDLGECWEPWRKKNI